MRNFVYAAILLGLFLFGCNISDLDFKNLKLERITSDIAVPFGTASYSMRELLEDASNSELDLEEDPETGELRLIYRDTASYTFTSDIFEVSDPTESSMVPFFAPVSAGSQQVTESFTQTYESVDGEVIDSVFHADNAQVRVTVSSPAGFDLDYELELASTLNVNTENSLSITSVVGAGGTDVQTRSLADHKTLLREVAGQNEYDVNLTLTLDPGESINGDLEVTIEFLDQDFIVVFGKLGQDTVSVSNQTMNIGFFDGLELDGVIFGGAELRFDFRSSFGLPIAMGFKGIYSEDVDGNQTFLTGGIVSKPPVVASSPTNHPVTGEVTQTLINVTTFNSNLEDLLSTSPTLLGFDIQGFTNAYDENALNFVTDTSTVRSYMELELPMEVSMTNVIKEIDFDIAGGLDFNEVDSMALRLVTVNELPFAGVMDLLILNNNGDTLFIAMENEALDQPFLNIDGTVREPKTNIEDIPLGAAGIEALANGTTLKLVISMNSPATQTSQDIYVKLLANAELEVTLGARAIIDTSL